MFANFFVDRPIFATVLSLLIVIVGGVALQSLPIAQYPEVAPPSIAVTTVYPGANAKTVAETVATPIEQQVNGVEDMLYMNSTSSNDGSMSLNVVFEVGTDLDEAQVLVQNRVAIAEAALPEEVKRQGVTTKKKSTSILLCVNLISPDDRYDQLYLSNYASTRVKDSLARIPGVGDVTFLGVRDFSIRVWLDPERVAARGLTASDVVAAIREQNRQVAAGRLGQPPTPPGQVFQSVLNAKGRLESIAEFDDLVVRSGEGGELVRIRDIGRTELGAESYEASSNLDGRPTVTLAVFQLPGGNALDTAQRVRAEMDRLAERFPAGLEHRIVYDTTVFVEQSVAAVVHTILEAIVLVLAVVLLFLQSWRATLIPMIAVPVSLIGTFAVMAAFGFSLNNLSLFGLVLAIGIVVDDAIVVVENVERNLATGLSIRDATRKAMAEVSGPVIAIAVVLCAVFVPTAFITGISGQFYRQFALTIAASTVISAFNSLTLSPALSVVLLGGHGQVHGAGHAPRAEPLPRLGIGLLAGGLLAWLLGDRIAAPFSRVGWLAGNERLAASVVLIVAGTIAGTLIGKVVNQIVSFCFRLFEKAFTAATAAYAFTVKRILRVSVLALVVYAGLMVCAGKLFTTVPTGFIPLQDKGYLIVNAQLPEGASLERTERVIARIGEIARGIPGVAHTIEVPGYSLLLGYNVSNVGGMFATFTPFEERAGRPELGAMAIFGRLRQELAGIPEAAIAVFPAPPVEGLGNAGGFKLQVEDLSAGGPVALQAAVQHLVDAGNAQPGLVNLFSSFRASQPQVFVDVDRDKARQQGTSLTAVFDTLQTYLGSSYINDVTLFGRNWKVKVQAEAGQRLSQSDVLRLKTRNDAGDVVPLATLVDLKDVAGPAAVYHYNLYPSAEISGATLPGTSSGDAIAVMAKLAAEELPASMTFEWTELSLQQVLAGDTALYVFLLAALFVFLALAAQYESWSLPLAIILIVPMCLLAAIAGVAIVGLDNDIFTQIGLVVLIGLSAKNAILIVEFAKQLEGEGKDPFTAAVEAARLRLRPIVMTSLAFILGVVPMVLATGAGAEMRVALGVAVFSGMVGVTVFGLFFTPVFYVVIRKLAIRRTPAVHG